MNWRKYWNLFGLGILLALIVTMFMNSPAGASTVNSGCPSGSWVISNQASNLGITYEGFQNNVDLHNTATCYHHLNGATWNGHPVYEWADSFGNCLYSGPVTNFAVVSANCQNGDGYEEWETDLGPSPGFEWWINRGITDFHHNGNDYFMTALGNVNGSEVAVYGPGYGNEAVWSVA